MENANAKFAVVMETEGVVCASLKYLPHESEAALREYEHCKRQLDDMAFQSTHTVGNGPVVFRQGKVKILNLFTEEVIDSYSVNAD